MLLNALRLRTQVVNEMVQNVFEQQVVVVMERRIETDWLNFDFCVVDFEDFDIRIWYDEHVVVVVVHYLDRYDFPRLL